MNMLPIKTEERVYLYPGTLWLAERPALITTVLGSCVSVCVWSDRYAGMNHYILPRGGSDRSPRYGNHALDLLFEGLLARGAKAGDLVAAIFGGASVLGPMASPETSLGRRNVVTARQFLADHDIPVVREDVGGEEGRKLVFRTIDGSTVVRTL